MITEPLNCGYVVHQMHHGILICGLVPVSDYCALLDQAADRGYDQLDLGIGQAEGGTALTHAEGGRLWREAIDAELLRRWPDSEFDRWWHGWDTGLSSMTIAHVLQDVPLTYDKPARVDRHDEVPADGDDLGRCLRLLERFPQWRERLPEVAARYPEWRPLVDVWDRLQAAYEAGEWLVVQALLDECRGVTR